MVPPKVSVIVRTFNSAATIEQALASVRGQTVEAELVVVDSGSTDETLEVVRSLADRLVTIEHRDFTFGRALNLGADAAAAEVHVALSSHCAFPHTDWLATALGHIAGGAVAAGGAVVDGERRPLTGPRQVHHEDIARHPNWGLSNHASAWAADVWRTHPFDETLPAAEDREWSLRVLAEDPQRYLVLDPQLVVASHHRRSGGVRRYYERLLREMAAMGGARVRQPFGLRHALHDWASSHPEDGFISDARPFGRTRLIEVTARYVAGRRARRSVR
jgi:rhamnosyltransferase